MRVARNPQNGRFVSLKRKRKLDAIKNLRLKNSTDEDKIKKHKAKVKRAKKTTFKINGNRIIDILYRNEQLMRGCKRCKEVLTFSSVTREQKYGLGSVFTIHCKRCNKNNKVKSIRSHKTGKRGIETFHVNSRLAIGMLDTGNGETHLRCLLSESEIPTGSHKTLKMRERECGYAIEKVAKASCTRATASQSAEVKRECKEGVRRKIIVSYDMRWAKRGKGMNSRSGFGSIIRKNKVLFYATRDIGCRFCAVAKHGKMVRKHSCRKNGIKSSKAMEPDVAVECLRNVIDSGLDPDATAGDHDSVSISECRKEVKSSLEKQCDYVHLKKNVFKKIRGNWK